MILLLSPDPFDLTHVLRNTNETQKTFLQGLLSRIHQYDTETNMIKYSPYYYREYLRCGVKGSTLVYASNILRNIPLLFDFFLNQDTANLPRNNVGDVRWASF